MTAVAMEAEVTGRCELPDMGARNQTKNICKNEQYILLTPEPSVPAPNAFLQSSLAVGFLWSLQNLCSAAHHSGG